VDQKQAELGVVGRIVMGIIKGAVADGEAKKESESGAAEARDKLESHQGTRQSEIQILTEGERSRRLPSKPPWQAFC
jgi:hypothetical protein